jgi:hypothetical protein
VSTFDCVIAAAAMDLDVLFAYDTVKTVRIQDR